MVDPKFVGKTYGPVKYEVGLEKIKEYAIAVGDLNELYLDDDAAARGPHGGIVAPPLFAVVIMRELMKGVLFDNELDLNLPMLVHGEQEFEFHNLARPGDVVFSTARIDGIKHKDGKDIVSVGFEAKAGDKTIVTGAYTFVVRG
ncbi:MAG: MaoC family dehydratase N-terminal domain-containing protein [Deltaproteobacteria bacterium]|nr:MaoC family dehydratase N-terminal domain-containing protein [Deltaproteobacteria bacterium]